MRALILGVLLVLAFGTRTPVAADAGSALGSATDGVRLVAGKAVEGFSWVPKGASILLGAFGRDIHDLATTIGPGGAAPETPVAAPSGPAGAPAAPAGAPPGTPEVPRPLIR